MDDAGAMLAGRVGDHDRLRRVAIERYSYASVGTTLRDFYQATLRKTPRPAPDRGAA